MGLMRGSLMREPLFDENGKVKDRAALRSITIGGRAGEKVTDMSTEHATITRVESDDSARIEITPHTVDLGRQD